MRRFRHVTLCLAALLLAACNQRATDPVLDDPDSGDVTVSAFGQPDMLEVVTWNIQNYPKVGARTVSRVAAIMLDLDADIYAVQEIESGSAFQGLLDSLNRIDTLHTWEGRLNREASFLLTGAVYKSDLITVLSETALFTDDSYTFAGRPPQALYMRAASGGRSIDFTLIVLHLKALGDETSRSRREEAVRRLHAHVEAQVAAGADPDFVLAGDWNDLLDDPASVNVFQPFLDDTLDYRFLTLPFAGSSTEFSYIAGFESLIDHILISRSIERDFPGPTARVLKVDQSVPGYISDVSDHRPVGVRIPVFD